jgi:hypothetical protein
MPKMKPENSYRYMDVTALLATMASIKESNERSTILGAHLFINLSHFNITAS